MAVQARSAFVTLAMAHLGMPNAVDANWKANPVNDVHGDSHGQKRISDPCKAAGDDWDVHWSPLAFAMVDSKRDASSALTSALAVLSSVPFARCKTS